MEKRECPHFQCPVCLTKNMYKILDYFRFRDRQVWRLEKRKTEKKDKNNVNLTYSIVW